MLAGKSESLFFREDQTITTSRRKLEDIASLMIRHFFLLTMLLSAILLGSSSQLASATAPTTMGVWSYDHSSANIVDPSLGPGSNLIIDITVQDLPPILNQ